LRHLRCCTDTIAHQAHRANEQKKAAAKQAADSRAKAQLSAAASAVWTFSGGRVEQLWMLDAEQLRKRCSQEGLSSTGSRDALIERLADHLASRNEGSQGAQLEDLPRELHSLSDAQLKAVCAAHRLRGLKSRAERLEALEQLRLGVAAIEMPSPETAKVPAVKGRAKALAIKDKRYLMQQGKRVVSSATSASPKAKAKAKGKAKAGPSAKRRRVVADED